MSAELTLFDYAGLPTDAAELCRIVEIRIKARTGMTVVENGRDLLAVKESIGHGKFTEWLGSWFPSGETTARKWMRIAEKYGDKPAVTAVLGTEALNALCSDALPVTVRDEVERRAVEGGDTSVAEIARLKREATEAKAAAAEALRAKDSELAQKNQLITASEQNQRTLIAERNTARVKFEEAQRAATEAKADKARAIAAADAAEKRLETERERVEADTWVEADEKYEVITNRVKREEAAKRQAAEQRAATAEQQVMDLKAAVEQARPDPFWVHP